MIILGDLFSSFSLRKAASIIAPPAPKAAAGVGLVIPPRIDPKTATIRISGGNTTRISSFSAKRTTAVRRPYRINTIGGTNKIRVTPGEVSGLINTMSNSIVKATPTKPTTRGRKSWLGATPRAVVRTRVIKINPTAIPKPIGAASLTRFAILVSISSPVKARL